MGAPEADSWLFPVRGLAQRRLVFDWNCSYGANESAASAGGPFFRKAVSAHRPVFLSRRIPLSTLSHVAPCTARRKIRMWSESWNRRPSWRREIPEQLRRWKAVGARSQARVAWVSEVPRPVAAG